MTDIHQDDHGHWFVAVRDEDSPTAHDQQIPLEPFVESWDRCGRLALYAEPLHGASELPHSEGHQGTAAGPHHPTSGVVSDHHPDEIGGLPLAKSSAPPTTTSRFGIVIQHHPDTCTVVSQKYIIEQFTGQDIPEDVLMHEAQDRGWYQPGGGTQPEDVGKLLELHGIPAHHDDHATVETLVTELGQGRRSYHWRRFYRPLECQRSE